MTYGQQICIAGASDTNTPIDRSPQFDLPILSEVRGKNLKIQIWNFGSTTVAQTIIYVHRDL